MEQLLATETHRAGSRRAKPWGAGTLSCEQWQMCLMVQNLGLQASPTEKPHLPGTVSVLLPKGAGPYPTPGDPRLR